MFKNGNASSIGVSVVVHGLLLGALAVFQIDAFAKQAEVVLETVFDDERVQEEFTKDLEVDTSIAETKNIMVGGAVSTAIGGSGAPAVAQQKIDTSESLKEPELQVNVGEISIPGENLIGEDLGEGEVNGEIGAVVEGYGAALSRITQELIRMMREQKIHVVWLFDESNSMKDDQQEIKEQFHKVYEELGIQTKTDKVLRQDKEVLLTSIIGFGKKLNPLTKKPTANINEIRAAIDRIPIDESGDENMCQAVTAVIKTYSSQANRQRRRLVIVIVSDESPTDDSIATMNIGKLETTIQETKRAKSPVYILGREAIFGYPYARITWKDPEFGLTHWVRIDRGPETAFPECLQYDGLHARWDSASSGFGPYSQVRLAKESGGIFFMLPGEEENLSGALAHEKRKFAALAMKEYQPLLLARRTYMLSRQKSKFRTALWNIIVRLNPHADKELSVRVSHYSIKPLEFLKEGRPQFQRAIRAMSLLNQSVKLLKQIEPLRAAEKSQRWRANYDLILAQSLAYRVRLFQYLLVLDEHMTTKPRPKKPKSNEWNIGRSRKMRVPDEGQFARLKKAYNVKASREEYLAELQQQRQRADEQYQLVESNHPGTPWARRARYELDNGYGMTIGENYRDPRYREIGKKIKIPKF